MSFLNRLLRRTKTPRVVFIGIDGTPLSFLQRMMREGVMPNLVRLTQEGDLRENLSVYPTVSSVAWSSFMTGVNPAKHGIYGFVDRQPDTLKPYIPTSSNMKAKTLWEMLSEAGKRVIVMNVPVTYPPRRVNGIMVGCFLSPSLEKATYPPEVSQVLAKLGYIVDVDPWAARRDKSGLLDDIHKALAGRERALFHYMDQEQWDYAHLHIMETDRLHHFLWEEMEAGDPQFAPRFFAFYHELDAFLGRVRERVDENTTLMLMSDHGFCTLRKEVYINRWLADQGWLKYATEKPRSVADMHPDSVAYSLDPGRVFINLRGREPNGRVARGAEYEALRDEIIAAARELRDPDSGEPMIQQAFRVEEIYHGPYIEQAADIILHPYNGYDLKGPIAKDSLTFKGSELDGMHTYDDAMLYISGQRIALDHPWVADPMPTILRLLDVPIPPDLDGRVLI